ncbi:chemotaxis protein CheB [Motiliproteus sediminis]|uniref:chemotaxis protein CheB n=1 Tax=Motiliproteus sediminis TaxID=1468178 RepID=UPI001AEFD477|nr:chemotaxis protein CheB [Motiliproteus sediminis]
MPSKSSRKSHRRASNPPAAPVTVVGIGASAGGLEALALFLAAIPVDSGLAFVVVQHQDPDHQGALPGLLQRATTLAVVQIEDGARVESNRVYLIPPDRDLALVNGTLRLQEPTSPRGLRLPIDGFFRTLADDQQNRSVGVVLSGMGSDGTQGLGAIRERAGTGFVQEPATAKFDSMPRSAIAAGFADVVAPPDALPGKIIAYLKHRPNPMPQPSPQLSDPERNGIDQIVRLLCAQTGHDFASYKKSTLYRRIERRMGLHRLPDIGAYQHYLQSNHQEVMLLFNELLIGVTHFFRDPEAWQQLQSEVMPALLAQYPMGAALRAWTPACSTGEEAYTLAIVFCEALAQCCPSVDYSLQIFATDLDADAIAQARRGVYPASIAVAMPESLLQRYFTQEESGYRVCESIREMVVFATQNLVMDPPFTKLDIITCRNLLIYLETDLQKKVLSLLHYSLKPDGFLLLGCSETVGAASSLFNTLTGKNRIYRRKEIYTQPLLVDFPATINPSLRGLVDTTDVMPTSPTPANLQPLTEQLLLQRFSPAAVLTTEQGDIVYISGKTGKYLEPAAGKANLNIFAMAREGLAGSLNAAFLRAVRERKEVVLANQKVGPEREALRVKVSVSPLSEPAPLASMVLITFVDLPLLPFSPTPNKTRGGTDQEQALATLTEELNLAHLELQTTREEMQRSQEQLKSANEELQSTNEELQSTNEELTTSREEMQSMNEELQTVNQELQAKVEELSLASDDMKNLLNSTNIATLFLDDELRVRRFTPQITELFKLRPGDAGRPITDLASELEYDQLTSDASSVLDTLIFKEREVMSRDGRWFRMRIMPYRAHSNRIDGVVITFIDISAIKALELSLHDALQVLQDKVAEQASDLDRANVLETRLRDAKALLEQRLRQE